MTSRTEPLYRVWAAMKNRCKDTTKPNYGGRGITVCDEWNDSYIVFRTWAESSGYREGLSIDREKNDLGYSPDNCRWTTSTVQSRNRRSAAGSSSKYIGVYRCNTRQMWVAQVTINKKKKTLGLHETELAAAVTRDQFIVDEGLSDFQMNNVL